jgi:lantibiotic leader peptide-processing serine protease
MVPLLRRSTVRFADVSTLPSLRTEVTMPATFRPARFVLTAVVAALAAVACDPAAHSSGPGSDIVAPEVAASAASTTALAPFAAPTGEATADHLFVFDDAITDGFAESVAVAGGEAVRVHPQIGVAVTRGLPDHAAQALAGTAAVVERDLEIQWVPSLDEVGTGVLTLPPEARPEAHDPTEAQFFPLQWNMRIVDVDAAWAAGFRGDPGVRVAIVDTGLDPFHIDLAGLVDEDASVAFVSSVTPGPTWGDDHFHGTHVGGTVVTNGLGTSGVAPHTTLIAVKVLSAEGTGTFGDVIGGILHSADVGANIINLSLGAVFPRQADGALVAALNRAVNHAVRSGALVVSAAGNAAIDLNAAGNFIATPCESGAGMCISSTGPFDALASYSNFGRRAIHLAAPGGDFITTGNLQNSTVLAPCSSLIVGNPCPGGTFYAFAQGTSMAAPHVAGAAALLDAQHAGGLNGARLQTRLERSADDIAEGGTAQHEFGRGRLNVCNLLGC